MAIGLVSGYLRAVDAVVMRVMDGMMAIPAIMLAIALIALSKASVFIVIVAVTLPEVPRVVRLVRSVVLTIREQPYIEAATAIGTSVPRIMLRHLLPNALPPLIVQATYICASAVLIEAALSFLGAGTPPEIPSWGNIMAEARPYFQLKPSMVLLPGRVPGGDRAGDQSGRRRVARHARSATRATHVMSTPVLAVDDLRTYFYTRDGVVKAVDGVSLSLDRGETLGVVGESGCGKSVTALSIMRLVPAASGRIVAGSIRFDGKELLTLEPAAMRAIRGNRIGMIFQEPMTSLNPVMTVGRQIAESIALHQKLPPRAALDRAIEMLTLVEDSGARGSVPASIRISSRAACGNA